MGIEIGLEGVDRGRADHPARETIPVVDDPYSECRSSHRQVAMGLQILKGWPRVERPLARLKKSAGSASTPLWKSWYVKIISPRLRL